MRRPVLAARTRALAFAGALLAIAAAFAIAPGLAVALAPAAGLLLLLVHGFFPGEETIGRLRARRHVPARRRTVSAPRPALPVLLRRTGRRIAFALAVRPPPAAHAVINS